MQKCAFMTATNTQLLTASSAWPWNTIFWPCCIPFSTWTSKTFFSWTTLLPLQLEHLSFSLMISPEHWTTIRPNPAKQYFQRKIQPHNTCSFAFRANSVHLLDHAKAYLSCDCPHSNTTTTMASSWCPTLGSFPESTTNREQWDPYYNEPVKVKFHLGWGGGRGWGSDIKC